MGSRVEKRLHVLGSSCRILLDNSDDGTGMLELAQEELRRLESKFGTAAPEGIIGSINQNAGTGAFTPLDAESRSLFNYVSALWNQSSHLFDPSTRILQNCFDAQGNLLASEDQLRGLLKLVGWKALEISGAGARLTAKGMMIDLDSCIRPYAVDCVRKTLARNGVKNALIEMDQDVASIGKQADGANWLVGVRHPKGSRTAIARIKLNDRGYAMRGNFERRVNIDGEYFGRALSPVDGHPVPGLLSVAVIADNCLTACSAANIARLKTEQGGIKWLEKLGLPWMAIDRQLNSHGPLSPA